MSRTELPEKSATELVRLSTAGAVGAVELTQAFLDRIERLDGNINSYITVTAASALRQARQLDRRPRGRRLALHGLPVAVKDLCATRGVRTTAGSKIFADWVPNFDAAVVERLRAAGAVLLGKHNMHELAYGVTTNNPHYGPARNPWDLDRIPGGSSGGSAAAVAAGLCAGAVGTDTGGSIRIPAGLCGVVGLKPTYGRVSRHGIVPLSWSLDHVGPLARTVEDAALLLGILAGADDRDPTSSRRRVDSYGATIRRSAKGVRLGVPREHFFEVLDPEVRAAFDAAVRVLRRLGMQTVPVSLPSLAQVQAAELAIMMPEAAAYHARSLRERPQDFAPEVRALLSIGRLIPATALVAAQRLRARLAAECRAAFARVEALVVPGAGIPAPRIDENAVTVGAATVDVGTMLSRNMMPFNLTGLPAIALPCGRSRRGLPISLQLAGPAFGETTLLRIAYRYEQATEWHRARPPVNDR